jgi:periplasmic protein TonB
VRKALIISLVCHVALTIGICRWKTFQVAGDVSRSVYEVELVDGVRSANSISSGRVEPAVFTPAGPEDATAKTPATDVVEDAPKPERDASAMMRARASQTKPDAATDGSRNGRAGAPSAAKGSRFAIDAPPGEAGSEPIGDIEARGAMSQPLHVTHPGAYSQTYIILRAVKPLYPEHERERSIEGAVTVELLVDTEGNVAHADVLELVGPESFSKAALDAVRQFEFQPPVENGEATTMWIKFVIKFRINS